MRSDPGVGDSLHQLGVFVDQPGLPQHVRRSVLQLKDKQTYSFIKYLLIGRLGFNFFQL